MLVKNHHPYFMSTWQYQNTKFTEPDPALHGFVYEITNTVTGERYIGKKSFWMTKIRQVKKKRKRVKVQSDWFTYYGSNKRLTDDVTSLGEAAFTRTILRLCASKAECSYWEAKEQFVRGVLETDGWYNEWIMVRVRKNNIKVKNAV
jgi:hypothetical protein